MIGRGWLGCYCLAVMLSGLAPEHAAAHAVSTSYVHLYATGLRPVLEVDEPLRDVADAVDVDTDGDGNVTWGEVRAAQQKINSWIGNAVTVSRGATRCGLRPRPVALELHAGTIHLAQTYDLACAAQGSWTIDYRLLFDRDRSHRALLAVSTSENDQPQAVVLDADRHRWEQGASTYSRFALFVRQGVWHIWQGYDHIAFLVLLLLPAVLRPGTDGRWIGARDMAAILRHTLGVVTAFTLAHSITLSLATLGLVRPPALPIEAGIALTVAVAGVANLFPRLASRGARIAFGFGLIHGFGFANALQELGVASGAIIVPLAGFNIGVELGQLAIVAGIVPLLAVCRDRRAYARVFLPAASLAVSGIACWWLLQRVGLIP